MFAKKHVTTIMYDTKKSVKVNQKKTIVSRLVFFREKSEQKRLHDGKPLTLSFNAPVNQRGDAESHRNHLQINQAEVVHPIGQTMGFVEFQDAFR